jgi:hypothetical protein
MIPQNPAGTLTPPTVSTPAIKISVSNAHSKICMCFIEVKLMSRKLKFY